MRLLIIDNNIDPACWGAGDLRRLVANAAGTNGLTVHVRRAPQEDLPIAPNGIDRVIVSGSKTSALDDAPWIDRLHDFIRATLNAGKPFLGVCYGHQSLTRALGGKEHVRKAAVAEFGWTKIDITETSPLTNGLASSFMTFSSHFDEVGQLPRGIKRLARSADCEVQACQVEGRPAYGIQFHPERDAEGAERTFSERRKSGTPKNLLYPGRSKELYDPKVGETLFRNFLEL